MATIPANIINVPISTGTGSAPPAGSGNFMGVSGAVGQIRWNPDVHHVEIWDGVDWLPVGDPEPETWQEWFSRYIRSTVSTNTDPYACRVILNQLMQNRFPGQYQVDCHNGTWTMTHNTPADETWFHLQYAK